MEAILDVVKDVRSGFIMENNSPECTAKNVIRALNYPNLEQIAENACALVQKEFTYERARERYKNVLDSLPATSTSNSELLISAILRLL